MTQLRDPFEAPREPSSARLVLTLAFAGLFSGLAIVGAHVTTLPIIEQNNARALREAVFKVVPGAERMQGVIVEEEGLRIAGPDEQPNLYAAYGEDGSFIGYAIPGEGAGFQDTIRILYGYKPVERQVVGMEVLESRETPGLGDKIYKDADFVGDFRSLSVDPQIVCVKPGEKQADHEVDAITGATISSKAVVSIINSANAKWLDDLEGEEPPPLETPSPAEPQEGGDDAAS